MKYFEGKIPLGLPNIKNKTKELKTRLWLLKQVDCFHDEMKEFLIKSAEGTFTASDEKKLRNLLADRELKITEVDKGLIFTHAFLQLPNTPKTSLNDKFDGTLFLSCVRAKLVFRELAYLILDDEQILLDLIQITLKYLMCPVVNHHVEMKRDQAIFSRDPKAKKFILAVSTLLKGETKRKKRQMWYWRGNYYFSEIKACIETYNSIPDELDKDGYLQDIKHHWEISHDDILLIKKKADSPTSLTFGILERKKIISDGEQFKIGYNKTVKELKESNLALDLLPSEIYTVFDLMSLNPLLFTLSDPFSYLSTQNYLEISFPKK